MKVHIFSVAAIAVCITFANVCGSDTGETQLSTDSNSTDSTNSTNATDISTTNARDTAAIVPGGNLGRRIGQAIRCFFACKRPSSPAECNCDSVADCQTKQCGDGEMCKMMKDRIPVCVKDKSVCDLPKSTIGCDVLDPGYFYNKDTRRCERYSSGECGNNLNMFESRKQCFRTCRSRPGKGSRPPRPGKGSRRPKPGRGLGRFRN